MTDMDQRESMLRQDGYLLGIAILSLLNGMNSSPYFDRAMIFVSPLMFSFSITSPLLIFYFTSLLLSLTTVILAGVPTALFERASGRSQSDAVSLSIWLGLTALIALPSLLALLRVI